MFGKRQKLDNKSVKQADANGGVGAKSPNKITQDAYYKHIVQTNKTVNITGTGLCNRKGLNINY